MIRRTKAGGAKKRPARYGPAHGTVDPGLVLARRAHRKRRWSEAIEGYRAAIARDPHDVETWMNLGAAAVSLGRADEATEAFRVAVGLAPDDARVARDAGVGLGAVGELEAAQASLERSVELAPQLVGARLVLSRLCLERGDESGARRWATDAVACAPEQASTYLELHRAVFCDRTWTAAIDAAERAVALDPEYTLARYFLGAALAWSGDRTAADRALEPSRRGAPPVGWVDALDYALAERAPETRVFSSSRAMLRHAMEACELDGPVLEFGVRHGVSTRVLAEATDCDVIAFDSFLGLPEPWVGRDVGAFSTAGRIPTLPAHVRVRAGWFEASLPAYLSEDGRAPRLVHVDSDLYSSAATVLDGLGPRIRSGCILVFDEYFGNERWRDDEHRAYDEAASRLGWTRTWLGASWITGQAVFRVKT